MINTQKVGVLVLSLVFLLCIPIHIFSVTQHTTHSQHAHHAEDHVVSDMFAHLGEMTNAPWVLSFIIIVRALLSYFAIMHIDACIRQVIITPHPRVLFVDTGGTFYWLTLHHTSPPSLV